MKLCAILTLAAVVAASVPACATTHRVDVAGGGDYENIWSAVNAAGEGDTILVAPGTYSGLQNTNIDPGGVNIVFLAESEGELPVVIDCSGEERAFYLHNDEDATTVISGFTVINGWQPSSSGLSCTSTSPTVENCTFENCYSGNNGGAFNLYNSQAVIRNCVFRANTADKRGGAVYVYLGAPQFISCLFEDNTIDDPAQPDHTGGALYLNSTDAFIANCTIAGNALDQIDIKGSVSNVVITNSIVAFSEAGIGVAAAGTGYGTVSRCVVFGNAAGDSLECQHIDNIFEDPLFCDDAVGDYTLCGDSPAYDENNPWLESIGAYGWGCEPCGSPVEDSTWGRVKALYR